MMTGIDARDATKLLGDGYEAKSLRYKGDPFGCVICHNGHINSKFLDWDSLVNHVNKILTKRGEKPYVESEPQEESTRRSVSFRLPLRPSVPEL